MDPIALSCATSATVEATPAYHDRDGSLIGIVLIKEKFSVDRAGRVLRIGEAVIRGSDEWFDPSAPATSSIKYPSDVVQSKPSTDVLVVGEAMLPYRQPAKRIDVEVRVGSIHKRLAAFGPRAWFRSSGTYKLSDPAETESVGVMWEGAWGGSDYETDPEAPVEEPRNPNGRGVVRDETALEGTLGPSIEDPSDLIRNHRSTPAPAGLTAIGRHWVPRRTYGGTIDDDWMTERMPLPPLDFDPRFNQAAPPDQITSEPMKGGEPVEIVNMSELGPVRFRVPKLRFFVGLETRLGVMTEFPPQLDTLLIEPTARTLDMTWRSVVPLPRRAGAYRHVQIHEKELI